MANQRMVVTRYGGVEVLNVKEEALPHPEKDEIRIKVLSAGIKCSIAWPTSLQETRSSYTVQAVVWGQLWSSWAGLTCTALQLCVRKSRNGSGKI